MLIRLYYRRPEKRKRLVGHLNAKFLSIWARYNRAFSVGFYTEKGVEKQPYCVRMEGVKHSIDSLRLMRWASRMLMVFWC
jgi:hypothetical protein